MSRWANTRDAFSKVLLHAVVKKVCRVRQRDQLKSGLERRTLWKLHDLVFPECHRGIVLSHKLRMLRRKAIRARELRRKMTKSEEFSSIDSWPGNSMAGDPLSPLSVSPRLSVIHCTEFGSVSKGEPVIPQFLCNEVNQTKPEYKEAVSSTAEPKSCLKNGFGRDVTSTNLGQLVDVEDSMTRESVCGVLRSKRGSPYPSLAGDECNGRRTIRNRYVIAEDVCTKDTFGFDFRASRISFNPTELDERILSTSKNLTNACRGTQSQGDLAVPANHLMQNKSEMTSNFYAVTTNPVCDSDEYNVYEISIAPTEGENRLNFPAVGSDRIVRCKETPGHVKTQFGELVILRDVSTESEENSTDACPKSDTSGNTAEGGRNNMTQPTGSPSPADSEFEANLENKRPFAPSPLSASINPETVEFETSEGRLVRRRWDRIVPISEGGNNSPTASIFFDDHITEEELDFDSLQCRLEERRRKAEAQRSATNADSLKSSNFNEFFTNFEFPSQRNAPNDSTTPTNLTIPFARREENFFGHSRFDSTSQKLESESAHPGRSTDYLNIEEFLDKEAPLPPQFEDRQCEDVVDEEQYFL